MFLGLPDPVPDYLYGCRIGTDFSVNKQKKTNNLDFNCFVTFYVRTSKTDLNAPTVGISKKTFKTFLCWHLESFWRKEQEPNPEPDPNP